MAVVSTLTEKACCVQKVIISIITIIIIIIIIYRHCTGHCSRSEHASASSLSPLLSSPLPRPRAPAVVVSIARFRQVPPHHVFLSFVLRTALSHLVQVKRTVPPASLSLLSVPQLLPHSWLLPEMQNRTEFKKGRRRRKKNLAGSIAKKKYDEERAYVLQLLSSDTHYVNVRYAVMRKSFSARCMYQY